MGIDVESLLAEVSADQPCGPDLSYDPSFSALEREARGTQGQTIGDVSIEGTEPNWRDVIASAESLMARTKDLNIALVLASASLAQNGLPGLRDGLRLVKGLCERHWDHFHPQLDPDDDNDPLERMNLIAAFAAPIGQDGDYLQFRKRLREAPLASSRQLGRYGLRDVLIANGSIQAPPGVERSDRAVIDGAFADTDAGELEALAAAATEAAELSKSLDDWLTTKVGAGNACNLGPWHDALREVTALLGEQTARLGVGSATASAAPPAPDQSAAPAAAATQVASPGTAVGGIPGSIGSREDVVATLGKILEYYRQAEPSSPVPLLIKRARRLVSMSFVDIIKDLSPDAMKQVRLVGGSDSGDDDDAPASASADPASTPPVDKSDRPAPVKLT